MRKSLCVLLAMVLAVSAFSGCTVQQNPDADDGKLHVVTTIFAPYDFARQVGGDDVSVTMLLRPGYVTKEQMEEVLGEEVLVSPAILEKLKDGEVARSPGMKYKHYAPKAQVTILRGDFAKYKAYVEQHAAPGVWALCFDGEGAQLPVPFIEYGKNHDGVTQAHHLFTALRDLDKHGAEIVYARCPEQDGVSMAVYNRLIRAAAFRVVEL